MLKDTRLVPDFPFRLLAEDCIGMSGSELRDLCLNAAMRPVDGYIVQEVRTGQEVLNRVQLDVSPFLHMAKGYGKYLYLQDIKPHPLRFDDFIKSDGHIVMSA
jgi:hypothetical protein